MNRNLVILGKSNCGKTNLTKNLLKKILHEKHKILIVDSLGKDEYKNIAFNNDMEYCQIYEDISNVLFNKNITFISCKHYNESPPIEILNSIFCKALEHNVDVVIVDEGYELFKDCESLNMLNKFKINIINSQFYMADKSLNISMFKNFFGEIFIVGGLYNKTAPIIQELYELPEYHGSLGKVLYYNNIIVKNISDKKFSE